MIFAKPFDKENKREKEIKNLHDEDLKMADHLQKEGWDVSRNQNLNKNN